jgi:Flp pilus assembly pilin Flp
MNHRRSGERGQTMTEYVVMLGLISVGIVLAFSAYGTAIASAIQRVASLIP